MSAPHLNHAIAPHNPADRACYLADLKRQYQRGCLRAQAGPSQPNDQVVALMFPHVFPAAHAET